MYMRVNNLLIRKIFFHCAITLNFHSILSETNNNFKKHSNFKEFLFYKQEYVQSILRFTLLSIVKYAFILTVVSLRPHN